MSTETKDFLAEHRERIAANYLASHREHDEKCEFDVRGFYLCHCSKRRREASGNTELPTDDLYFPPPDCPRCSQPLEHDDGWHCVGCSVAWDSDGSGSSARFTDEFGDDLAGNAESWRSKNVSEATR